MENSSQCKWRPEDAWNQRVKVPGNSPGYYYSNHKDHLFVIDSLDLNTCPVDLSKEIIPIIKGRFTEDIGTGWRFGWNVWCNGSEPWSTWHEANEFPLFRVMQDGVDMKSNPKKGEVVVEPHKATLPCPWINKAIYIMRVKWWDIKGRTLMDIIVTHGLGQRHYDHPSRWGYDLEKDTGPRIIVGPLPPPMDRSCGCVEAIPDVTGLKLKTE